MLTQVYNRSGFFYYAKSLRKNIRDCGRKEFLLFFDLDGLKRINDLQGHEYGDRCIREMADVLRATVDTNDLIMRYGGDEFVVFGVCDTEEDVRKLEEKIDIEIGKRNQRKNRTYQLSVSIGHSIHDYYEMEDMNGLIEQADKEMYEEKRKKKKV